MKTSKERQRKRTIPHVFGNDRLEELLWNLLDDRDPQLRAYVYRIHDDRKDDALYIGPPYIGPPFHSLIAWLRDEHGGGKFQIIIRRGKRIELSGIIGIAAPIVSRNPR